jgi:hypothetical protein
LAAGPNAVTYGVTMAKAVTTTASHKDGLDQPEQRGDD